MFHVTGMTEVPELGNHISHVVWQTNRVQIHEGGQVDVLITMTFHLAPGVTMSGSRKSILPSADHASVPSLVNGSVRAMDGDGQDLRSITSSKMDGTKWTLTSRIS